MTKLAMVIQRYGPDIRGGAEIYCRSLAMQLQNRLGWDITIYTTCSRDYLRWDNAFPPGPESDRGLTVLRFPSRPHHRWLFGIYKRLLRILRPVLRPLHMHRILQILEKLWIELQGPRCPAMLSALRQAVDHYDAILAFTYLYKPTRDVVKYLGQRVCLVPFAHNEEAFFFSSTAELFAQANVVLPVSKGERDLLARHWLRNTNKLFHPAGIGFDESLTVSDIYWPKKPYLLYLGRIGKGKAVDRLIMHFLSIKEQFPGIKLLLAGAKDAGFDITNQPEIEYRGEVTEAEKSKLIQEAFALINPSPYESLSLVVIEAQLLGAPVIANAACQVFQEFNQISPTIFLYQDEIQLLACLEKISKLYDTPSRSIETLRRSQSIMHDRFDWSRTLERYESAVQQIKSLQIEASHKSIETCV